jgi:hypothetical protein
MSEAEAPRARQLLHRDFARSRLSRNTKVKRAAVSCIGARVARPNLASPTKFRSRFRKSS